VVFFTSTQSAVMPGAQRHTHGKAV